MVVSLPASKVSAEEEEKVMIMKEGGLKVDVKEPVRHHLSLGHVVEEVLVPWDILGYLRTRLQLLPTGCWFSCLEGKGGG